MEFFVLQIEWNSLYCKLNGILCAESFPQILCNSSDRGLCGGINSSIAKAVRLEADELEKKGGNVRIAIVGEKGKNQLKRLRGSEIDATFSECVQQPITFSTAAAVAENLIKSEVDEFTVLHQHFISQIAYEPQAHNFPNFNADRKVCFLTNF